MQKTNYKKYFSHKVEHDDFVEKLKGLNFHQIDENQEKYIQDLLGFVSSWIINHILENDKLLMS